VSGRTPWALRVVVVSRDPMLSEALDALVEAPGEVSRLDWHAAELEDALYRADVLVIDLPPRLHERTFAVIGGRFLGRTVVLLQEGEAEEALPPGPWVVRYRPLQIAELWAAITGDAAPPAPAARPAPEPRRMIGWSGRELEPVVGPGQVAPGMDAGTLERLRRWQARARAAPEPAAGPEVPPVAPPRWRGRLARPAGAVLLAAAVGLGAAAWRGGPDVLAGEVATAQAAGSAAAGRPLLPDPRVGPVSPLHAAGLGGWLRVARSDTDTTLEATVRAARAPSRALAATAAALTVVLSLLLMRVGPGSGAAAGPGPAPPHPPPARRLAAAAAAGLLAATAPLLVHTGRVATATALALVLALATLALAWTAPPPWSPRRLALLAAGAGLALVASPLALPLLLVPPVAAMAERRPRAARQALAAVGLGAALWAALPLWLAGQGLDPWQAGRLLGRPPGRGSAAASLAASPPSWLLAAAGLAAAAWAWRRRRDARPLALTATTAAGAVAAVVLGWPAEQALAFALPAAAAAAGLALADAPRPARPAAAALAVAAGLLVAHGVDWANRYGRPDDALARLAGTAGALPGCSAVNARGPDARARLLAAGVNVTGFASGRAAAAAGVRYFALTGDPAASRGGRGGPALDRWVRQHGRPLADLPSPTFSRVQLWQVDAGPLDPGADSLPVPGGAFSNVAGSACGGHRVVDGDVGGFHRSYLALGGKAVLGRPLSSVWTSDGPALQAFDTMVLGAVPSATGRQPSVRPVELPLLLAKLDPRATARAGVPRPTAPPPATAAEARVLMAQPAIARFYLGTDAAAASAAAWRRAAERFGRPLGLPQVLADGTVRQPFERAVIELPAAGGAARPMALGQLAVRVGLVPEQARRLEPVPGLPPRPAPAAADPGPLLLLLAAGIGLLALGGTAATAVRRDGPGRRARPVAGG
jgi:hypothetical protein